LSEIAVSTTWQPGRATVRFRIAQPEQTGGAHRGARRHAAARPQRDILGGGEIRFGRLDEVKTEIQRCESPVDFDLKEMRKEEDMKSKSTESKPSIVFCHGLWADGSCFSKVIPALQAEGHQVIAAQYGLDTTADDVATVRRTLGRVSSPAILVGHSYGGSVITGAGNDDRVAGLVYIAALAPDADETSQTQQSNFPKTDVFSYIEVADGRIWLLPEGIDCFAGDLSEQEKKLVWATHFGPAADLFNAKVGGTAWRSKPSWYIVAKNDRTVHPDMERFVAKRMGATTTEVASSHVPMLSHPDLVIDVIRAAAKAVQGATVAA
jgi:pimeloyl-ACP methyl ester carboxylesterase